MKIKKNVKAENITIVLRKKQALLQEVVLNLETWNQNTVYLVKKKQCLTLHLKITRLEILSRPKTQLF